VVSPRESLTAPENFRADREQVFRNMALSLRKEMAWAGSDQRDRDAGWGLGVFSDFQGLLTVAGRAGVYQIR
jgi:hypothetical protein